MKPSATFLSCIACALALPAAADTVAQWHFDECEPGTKTSVQFFFDQNFPNAVGLYEKHAKSRLKGGFSDLMLVALGLDIAASEQPKRRPGRPPKIGTPA